MQINQEQLQIILDNMISDLCDSRRDSFEFDGLCAARMIAALDRLLLKPNGSGYPYPGYLELCGRLEELGDNTLERCVIVNLMCMMMRLFLYECQQKEKNEVLLEHLTGFLDFAVYPNIGHSIVLERPDPRCPDSVYLLHYMSRCIARKMEPSATGKAFFMLAVFFMSGDASSPESFGFEAAGMMNDENARKRFEQELENLGSDERRDWISLNAKQACTQHAAHLRSKG